MSDHLCKKKIIMSYVGAELVCWKIVVSQNALHSTIEATLGDLALHSANFCAKNPPNDPPKM